MSWIRFETADDLDLAVDAAREAVSGNGVILLPTETYYGLAADPCSVAGVGRVMALKMRPAGMPLPVLAGCWKQVEDLAEVPERFRADLEASWPGPLTAVLPARVPLVAAAGPSIAIRIPGHPLLRTLLDRLGPLTGTSANRHGMPPPTTVEQALVSLNGAPDLVLDGGRTTGGGPSTVVSLTGDRPRLLRPGKSDEILERFVK